MSDSDPPVGLFYVFNLVPEDALEAVGAADGIPFRPRRARHVKVALLRWGWLFLWPAIAFALDEPFWAGIGLGVAGLTVLIAVALGPSRVVYLNKFGIYVARREPQAYLWVHARTIALRKRSGRLGESYALTLLGQDRRIFDVSLAGMENPMEIVLHALHFSTHAPRRLAFFGFTEQEAEGMREFLENVLPDFRVRRFRYEAIT